MKKLSFLAGALFIVASSFGQTWSLDKSHAKLGFSVTHLLVSDVEGTFKKIDVKLTSANADFTDAQIELTADVYSVNTDNDQRDTHLRSADFFDVEKTPTITFKSKSLTKVEGKNYKLAGDLTFHGVTKPVVLDVVFNGTAIHPYTKKTVAGFKITGIIKRTDFAFGSKFPEAVLSDEVAIRANAEFIKD
jgi:polyisoprenoid-binding protein YceI